jgi:uncharacterized protein (TIGR00730 family)
MKKVCVFCGSSPKASSLLMKSASDLGDVLVKENLDLVYGGAKIGLMGELANKVLLGGGKVTGIIPEFLQIKEITHDKITELIVCKSMHERKSQMAQLSDAFIALPGGFGTLEEILEVITWQQLGIHEKPIGILNIDGFYSHLQKQFEVMKLEGLLSTDDYNRIIFEECPEKIISLIQSHSVEKSDLVKLTRT